MNKEIITRIVRLIKDYYDENVEYEELFKQAPELDSARELYRICWD